MIDNPELAIEIEAKIKSKITGVPLKEEVAAAAEEVVAD
jgi:hypothetical protein